MRSHILELEEVPRLPFADGGNFFIWKTLSSLSDITIFR